MDKAALRRKMRRLRAAIPDRPAQSEQIRAHLPDLPGKTLIFVSFRSEVDTHPLLEGEGVLVPRIEGRQLVAVPLGELVPGTMGIPTCEGPAWEGPIDTILMPGLAFDRRGGRLGYGGGYYDRFCAGHPEARRIALSFREQVIDEVPMIGHDLPVHGLCTPDGLLSLPG